MKKIFGIIKATIFDLIVAFLFIISIRYCAVKLGEEKFIMATHLLQIITIKPEEPQNISPVLEGNVLVNYPTFGTKYAEMQIESINLKLPVYYGANYTILKSGIAHDETSYFPGEGGSVIMAGHNFKSFLANLPKVKEGEIITLNTTYGTFNYKVSKTKIVNEDDVDEVPVKKDKEVLMLYTCWPINNIGHASQRYVVYADLVK